MNVSTPSASFLLEKGRLVAINSGVPHAASADGGMRPALYGVQPALICGSDDSVFARKYMRPLACVQGLFRCFAGGGMRIPLVRGRP